MAPVAGHSAVHERPVGIIQPTEPRAQRALKAVAEDRLRDAQSNIDAIADAPLLTRAWKRYLQGTVCIKRRELTRAAPAFMDATSAALLSAGESESGQATGVPASDALRLAAKGFEAIGQVRRRQDQPQAAARAHVAAYLLRYDHGSFEEVWESALSLAIDAELTGDDHQARSWYHSAVQFAAASTHDPAQKQAVAWTRLSASMRQTRAYADAVAAARTARSCWQSHDPGAADTARADMNLGHALLALGESLHGQADRGAQLDGPTARTALQEALTWLSSARESLLAFGPPAAVDVQWCNDQIDFTNRLLNALE